VLAGAAGIAAITAIGVGGLSWAVDRIALKFFVENYSPADTSVHVISAVLAAFAVMLFTLFYLGLDHFTAAAKGFYTAVVWVLVAVAVAYVALTTLSVYAVVYLVVILGAVIPLSYIPKLVTSNRYVSEN